MARLDFDEFGDLLEQVISRIPERYYQDLYGGFNLKPEHKSEHGFTIMGQYVEGGLLGCFVVFYYGSFVHILGDAPRSRWEKEIMDTVVHELQHHLESLAGRNDLARQETEELALILQQRRSQS